MLGWLTKSFLDLHLQHHRYTGTADGIWVGLVKNGRANYVCGYHPLFMVAKCLRRLPQRPYLIGSLALLYGFISGYLKQAFPKWTTFKPSDSSAVSNSAAYGGAKQFWR